VDAAFTCVQTRRSDDDCVGAAGAKCRKGLARLAGDVEKARNVLASKCGDPTTTYPRLRQPAGLALGATDAACAALGYAQPASPADFAACVLRHHECQARDLLDSHAPRGSHLLAGLGMPLPAGPCPLPESSGALAPQRPRAQGD
jgi:hypothetical protein